MNIAVTGATGFIGRRIIDLALRRGHEVVAFSRHPHRAIPGCEMRTFPIVEARDLRGCESVIHLAGEPIMGLWTAAKKRRIRESRIAGTRQLVEALNASVARPEALICGSAVGFYEAHGDEEIGEDAPSGKSFLSRLTREWEEEALGAKCRVALLRTGIVLGRKSGALGLLEPLFRAGLGGTLGGGRQWMPWIHVHDEAMLALFAAENLAVRGALNACAPWPVRNVEFTSALAGALHRPAFFRVPQFAIRLLGELSHEFLDSRRVAPRVAAEHGFPFRFPELNAALKDIFP